MALALYRRYRPDTFDGLIGQDQVTIPLCRALDQGKITHAYLFSGPRGCGKTSSARILARCINCEKGPTSHPCGKCQSCKDLATGGSGSVDVVEIDAASHNGVDDARELRERAGFAPARDRYKIFILDEAHMVTPQGFNALLKIVEEPPEHVMFIFATTEPDKVIGTIRSRTHHYPFRLVPPEIMGPYVEEICKKEKIEPEPGVLRLAMRAGGGSMRDTLSILDQLMLCAVNGKIPLDSAVALLGFTPSSLIGEVIDALIDHDGAKLYEVVNRVVVSGFDSRKFVEDLLGRMRDLLLIVSAGIDATSGLLDDLAPEELSELKRQSEKLNLVDLSRMAEMTNSALSNMASAVSPRMNLEILMARLLSEHEDRVSSSQAVNNYSAETKSGFAGARRNRSSANSTVNNAVNNAVNNDSNSNVNENMPVIPDNHSNKSEENNTVNIQEESGWSDIQTQQSSEKNSNNSPSVNQISVNPIEDNYASQSPKKQLTTDDMWDEVVSTLPEDVREYVSKDCVTKVHLVKGANGKQRLVLTFNKPINQYAFALAICTTDPYEGQKVPVVVMNAVKREFGANCMIAPDSVASDGETVEVVTKMSPERLRQVKREVLMRKTGSVSGFASSATSNKTMNADNPENNPENNSEKNKPEELGFQKADGYAASVESTNTAADYSVLASSDAWADVSSMPVLDSHLNSETETESEDVEQKSNQNIQKDFSNTQNIPHENKSDRNALDKSDSNEANLDKFGSNESGSNGFGSNESRSIESSSDKSDLDENIGISYANSDECSLEDKSLDSIVEVSDEEIKKMFEVKEVQDFSADDSRNPKNFGKKKKTFDSYRSKEE